MPTGFNLNVNYFIVTLIYCDRHYIFSISLKVDINFIYLFFFHSSFRIAFNVFPSDVDDVITSPYNAALSNSKIVEHADLIIPFDNHVSLYLFSKKCLLFKMFSLHLIKNVF